MTNRIAAADFLVDEPDPFRWTMGVKPLDPARWLLVDDDADVDLAEVRRLVAERRDEVLVEAPGSGAASEELSREVRRFLEAHHPARLVGLGTDPTVGALLGARLLVQEDLCILERRLGGWTLTAAAVAAPTAWDVPSKLGRDLDGIHQPVPRYRQDLAQRMRTFFDRLAVDRPVWRANRTLTDDPALRQDPPLRFAQPTTDLEVADVGRRLWLRVEYQTLRRLPDTGAIVFTIRILRQRLDEVANQERHPGALDRLMAGIEAIPADVADYKRTTTMYREAIRGWAAQAPG